jgi:cytidylate kinase
VAVLVVLGLPGTGKTTLACAIAARRPGTLVLHTDLLKVTLRAAGLYPAGPVWAGDLAGRLAAIRPFLDAHRAKAAADGYDLVIEGTLALGIRGDAVVRLELPEALREARIATKPASARRCLEGADLSPYREALGAATVDRVLDAGAPTEVLVGQALLR